MKEFKNLKRVAIEELEKLDSQYANKNEFTEKDAEMYRCLMSGLSKQITIEKMTAPEAYEGGMSGYHGRSMDGWRMEPSWQNEGMSGYYPHAPYPPDRYRY